MQIIKPPQLALLPNDLPFLYILGLSPKTTEVDIRYLCSPFGRLAYVHMGRTKYSARAKVAYQNTNRLAACLSKARDELNKSEFGDRILTVVIVGDVYDDNGQELGIEFTGDIDDVDDDTLDERAYALLTE